MRNIVKASTVIACSLILAMVMLPGALHASEPEALTDPSADVSATDLEASESEINDATSEPVATKQMRGTLIEIGNTTAPQTTIVVRVSTSGGGTEDVTLEINESTTIVSDADLKTSLSDWIAGDPISFVARQYTNSNQLVAIRVKNLAFKSFHRGINGWIQAIRAEKNEVDVLWGATTYTLNVSNAHIVAGNVNPATIADLKLGDRVRARVVNDGDGNRLTWNAKILVVLRRGNALFMRITRWVVPAEITFIPENITLPTSIEVKVLPSKFYEQGDVNNLIGPPGTIVTVDINEKTKVLRRFFGKAFLSEFSEGDQVQIVGRLDEQTKHLVATWIKNNTIQRLGVAQRLGKVTAIDATANTLTVELISSRLAVKIWTVTTSDQTKFYSHGKEITFSDIKIGDVIRVRGTANRAQHMVAATVVAVVTPVAVVQ